MALEVASNNRGSNNPNWKGGLVKVGCGHCGTEVEVKPYRLRNKTGKVFCNQQCLGKWLSEKKGDKSYNWKGGLNDLQNTIRKSNTMKAFIFDIYERDEFTCKKCNHGSNKLNAHHIKSVSKILRENNITTIQEAIECKELWNIKNAVTLCKECHEEFHLIYGRAVNTFKEKDYYEWINNIKIAV